MKILIAGLGSIGQRHARNLRILLGDRVDLLAFRVRGLPDVITEDMTIDPSATVEQRYGIRAFGDLQQALDQQPAAVIVCNPTRLHLPTAMQAIRANCHVLLEKPIADTYDGVDDLVTCAERRGLVAAVGYQMRFHPALLRLRQLITAKRVGRIEQVSAEWSEYLPDAHPYEDYRRSYAARADLGGGVILCYIHEFDYLTWLFGAPVRVTTTGGRSGVLDADVEDIANTTMVTAFDGRELAIDLRQCFSQRTARRTCVVRGERGTITVDLRAPSLEICRHDGAVEREMFPDFRRNDMFIAEMKQFLAAIDGAPVAVSAAEGAISLRAALAARRSLLTGQTVELR